MKKCLLFITVILIAAVVFTACEPEQEPPNTNPKDPYANSQWLIGTWSNSGAAFTISADFSFVCDLASIPGLNSPARVLGKLDKSNSNLGPNDYLMIDMTTAGEGVPNETYTSGNQSIKTAVEAFSGSLVGTLSPNSEKNQFTFSTTNMAAQMFFGGFGPYDIVID